MSDPIQVKVTVKDFGLREKLKRLNGLSTENLRLGMEQVGRKWLRFVDAGFKNERDPYGNNWEGIAFRTIMKKRDRGSKNPFAILQDSGEMRDSFVFRANSKGLTIWNARGPFEDGSGPGVHQYGGTTAEGFNIPARPMVPTFERGVPAEWFEAAQSSIQYAWRQYMEKP